MKKSQSKSNKTQSMSEHKPEGEMLGKRTDTISHELTKTSGTLKIETSILKNSSEENR